MTPESWNNSYQVWDLFDPHRRAFEVLYSELSVEIYLRLEKLEKKDLDDTKYLQFVEQKCVGCHATPPPGSIVGANLVEQSKPDAYWQGVSCESCHGAAGDWYGRHYSESWQNATTTKRASFKTHDFEDLRPLASRAAVCLKCHVGPQTIGTLSYDVNHDLIAAGHPRLNFEFNAYLTNLPKHWNAAADRKHQGEAAASFHFEAWRVGQVQKIAQVTTLRKGRPQEPWAEFANHDCRQCHHAIGEPNFVWNKREPWTLDQLTIPSATEAQQATLLQGLINGSRKPIAVHPAPGFEEAVDLYLAASAWSQDRTNPSLKAAVDALREEIEQQHRAQEGTTQYDLIDGFNPQSEKFRQAILNLESELSKPSP